MSKSKLSWIIAIILAVVLALPIVNAQSISGLGTGNIKFFLINAAVIFFVLFLLQAILVPGKEGKEKTSMWVIMIGLSLVVSWFYGSAGYVWQTGPLSLLFNLYVIVNAAIIGMILYLVSGFLDLKTKLKSPEGGIGFTLIIFFISLIIAVKIGPQWIWSNSMVRLLIDFLFHVDAQGYGGILNPFSPYYKLWIFVSLFVVFSFFFNNFLLTGGAEKSKMSYALAIILAGHMAYNGISTSWAINISEILFILVFEKSLKASITTNWLRWIVAILLVLWAGYAISSATGVSSASSTILGGGASVGGVAYGIGWIFKAVFLLIAGAATFFAINKYFPGGTGGAAPAAVPPGPVAPVPPVQSPPAGGTP